jgi:hypothetical protein
VAAAALQAVIAAYGWQVTRALWPQGDGHNRVVGPLLEFVGGSESLLPALRVEPQVLAGAGLLVGLTIVINLALWVTVKRHDAHLPSDAGSHVG